jgi:hypothetical protein
MHGTDGEAVEMFAYNGACELQGPPVHGVATNFVLEFRGQMAGEAFGATPAERLADARTKVLERLALEFESVKKALLEPPKE